MAIAGPLWALLMVADLFFGYANVAGRQIGGENFGDELAFYLTEISSGRAALVAAVEQQVRDLSRPAPAYRPAVAGEVLQP